MEGIRLWREFARATGVAVPDLGGTEERGCGWEECGVEVARNKCAGCRIARWVLRLLVRELGFEGAGADGLVE